MREDEVLVIPLRILSADETFVVALVKSLEHGETFCASGNIPINLIGCTIKLIGKYTDNGKRRGKSFKVTHWEMATPKSVAVLSRIVKALHLGLSTSQTQTLFSEYKEDTFNILKSGDIDKIKAVLPDVEEDTIKSIQSVCKSTFLTQEATKILAKYRQGTYLSNVVIKHYGDRIEDLKKNPYLLCNIEGISFPDLDKKVKWLQKDNFNPKFPGRIAMGIIHAMKLEQMKGDVFTSTEHLTESVVKILGIMPSEAKKYLNMAVYQDALRLYNGQIYLSETEEYEASLAQWVFDVYHAPKGRVNMENVQSAIKQAEQEDGITLGDMQRLALEKALSNTFSIITGGPGCGKTTCINQLLHAYKILKPNGKILAAAPTGRAARRLAEATGEEAKTLHSVLKIVKGGKHPRIDVLDADLIIVDEFSMCDIFLSEALFSKTKIGTKMVIVGDVDQLPSVDCGNVFSDLIDCGIFPVTVLNTTYRQANGSAIIENAIRINKNLLPLKSAEDFRLMSKGSKSLIDATELCVKAALKEFRPQDIMVLSPFRKSDFGVAKMNAKLQELLNPKSPIKNEYYYNNTCFRIGDRVMQTVNDLDRNVYNGDIGYITDIVEKTHGEQKKGIEVRFETGNVQFYTASMINELQLAFAITIHKSQGSEFPCAIVMFTEEYANFRQKKLVYTAVTRAKKKVILISDSKSIAFAASSSSPFEQKRRNSFLAQRLKNKQDVYEKNVKKAEEKLPPKPKKPVSEQVEGQTEMKFA